MSDAASLAYHVASFICALFVLEFGADKFIDHTVVVAKRTGIPEAIIGLLTAGAEWEELAVVIVCILRNRSSLAIGNIVGSAISNILGAFSLGLVFRGQEELVVFDSSAKAYTLAMLLVTCLVGGLSFLNTPDLSRISGGILIVTFGLYVVSVAYLIFKGRLIAPESDSDSDSDSDSESDVESIHNYDVGTEYHPSNSQIQVNPTTPLLESQRDMPSSLQKHSTAYHIVSLAIGFLAIILSSLVLSTAASTIAEESGMSEVLFGVVFLSVATTLPEKFIAVMSGRRNRMGILVANTVGSNIFLLTLCIGILWVSTAVTFDRGTVNVVETGVLLGSSLFMTLAVWFGAQWSRIVGLIMLFGYIAFLVLEFTTIRHG